jgi:hypothetical protein
MYISGNGDIYDDEEVIFNNNSRLISEQEENDEVEFMEFDELILKWEKSLRI